MSRSPVNLKNREANVLDCTDIPSFHSRWVEMETNVSDSLSAMLRESHFLDE
jgi:hypothetical protein